MDVALFFHLLGAFVFVAGIVVAGVAHAAACRRRRPDEIALLLGLARVAVLLVGLGAAVVLVFGLWLVNLSGHSLGEPWLVAALGLFAAALALGAAGGRRPRQARRLASRLAESGRGASPELYGLLGDRASAAANYLAALMIMIITAPDGLAAGRVEGSLDVGTRLIRGCGAVMRLPAVGRTKRMATA